MSAQPMITFSTTHKVKEAIAAWRDDHPDFNLSRLITAYLELNFGCGEPVSRDGTDHDDIEGVQAMLTEDRLEQLRASYRAEVDSGRREGYAIGAELAGTWADIAPLDRAHEAAKDHRLREALWLGEVDGRPWAGIDGEDALDLAIHRREQAVGASVTSFYQRALMHGFERGLIDSWVAAVERISSPEYRGPAPSFIRDQLRAQAGDTSEFVIGEPRNLQVDWGATPRRDPSEGRSDLGPDPSEE